ncbi:hypothetical protein SAMN02910298_01921 [Pseudobutyrivibrio sp. YE44]|uniref:hypothetical protein n=1 Tax=Pseudobutyrivibrio sp. YE44 TaxID=1520802 RepID=UPI00088FE706|nr:hypothetical protein [Pseudobutyrivibrio sp. YE44]SDB38953.1 hypothetical protein SAMN02910298_01921 [Pseudobutyrivibrio sp. YE44]
MEKKKLSINLILGILYTAIFLPIAFAIMNSVPASDDFAFGSNTISDNLLVNAAGYSWWNWKYHSGRWLTFFFQKMINPLNSHTHLGRTYGVWMMAVFALTFIMLHYSLNTIYKKMMSEEHSKIAVFLSLAVFYTTYYYSETYNWYVGATAYAIPLGLLLLTVAFTIKYYDTENNKYYVLAILAGLIPATNEFMDVAIGLLYIYTVGFISKVNLRDKSKLIKAIIPLVIFIIGGITVVFAPGNFARQQVYEIQPDVVLATRQIIYDMLIRIYDILRNHPLALVFFALLFILGLKAGTDNNIGKIVLRVVLLFLVAFGTLFPYVYGRAMTTSYLDIRMQYLLDFIIEIGIAITFLGLGGWISNNLNLSLNNKIAITVSSAIVVLGSAALIIIGRYQTVIQYDIYAKRQLIKDSYAFWDGVITEIENSPEDDVVIHRPAEITWSPYFLYTGLTDGDVYAVKFDTVYDKEFIMPNVYYGKKSIQLNYDAE